MSLLQTSAAKFRLEVGSGEEYELRPDEPLGPEGIRELLEALIGTDPTTRGLSERIHERTGEWKWTDVPYRVMIPKELDGLMAVGRSASCKPDTLLRNRMAVMHMGQAGGTAAALAAKNGVSPGELNVRELQESLLEAGFYLGDRSRLRALKLA